MRTEIARIFQDDGPFLSVYLATPARVEHAGHLLDLRWKDLRRELLEEGVPDQVVAAVEPLVSGAHHRGGTLAVIASASGVTYSLSLPELPPRDALWRYDSLPDVLPLLSWWQRQVPHVAARVDREGADVLVRLPGTLERREHLTPAPVREGWAHPLSKRAPGGWSQRRAQGWVEHLWKLEAKEVTAWLVELVDRVEPAPRFVALAGDVRMCAAVREEAPARLASRLRVLPSEPLTLDDLLPEVDRAVGQLAAHDLERLLDRFREERGQREHASSGLAPTLEALRRARVGVLLLGDLGERRAWFGSEATQVGLERGEVEALGAETPVEGRLADVLVRAAAGTGAEVRVLGRGHARVLPAEQVGALLRY